MNAPKSFCKRAGILVPPSSSHSEQILSMLANSTTQASNREPNNPNLSRLPEVPPIGGSGPFLSKASLSPNPSFPSPKLDSAAPAPPLLHRDVTFTSVTSGLICGAPHPPAANPHKAPRWAQHDKQAPAACSSAERARRGRGGILRGCHSRLPRL